MSRASMFYDDEDLYWEHEQHTTYQDKCSTCSEEAEKIKEHNAEVLKKFNPLEHNNPYTDDQI